MPLEPVHVMEMDRSTSRLELTHINKTRVFLMNTSNGMAQYTWQNGQWFDTGSNPMLADDVPEQFRKEIADHPVTVVAAGAPTVTATCRICGNTMNTSDMEEHLLEHVNKVMLQAGAQTAPPPEPPPPAPEERKRPRQDS